MALKVKIYNQEGKVVGEETLNPDLFEVPIKPEVVHQVVVALSSSMRQLLAHTKTRAEVRGGGRKPWRQKGTGRARHGSIRSPIWRGGGVVFGPRTLRVFKKKINKKVKRLALKMALSDKAKEKKIVLLDKLNLAQIKTKKFLDILKKLPVKRKILTILPQKDEKIIKSARNIPYVKVVLADSLNVLDILSYDFLLLPKASLSKIEKTYLK